MLSSTSQELLTPAASDCAAALPWIKLKATTSLTQGAPGLGARPVKAIAITEPTHNPIEQTYWASGLRENFTSRSYGEGLETGRKVPRQSLTRQLFFRWIKMHLRVKAFFGTSENAVKSQIWIAVSVYVLVAIIKKRLNLSRSLYEMLQ